jgi:hypothetical protein
MAQIHAASIYGRIMTVNLEPNGRVGSLGSTHSRLKYRDDRNSLRADIVLRRLGQGSTFVILITEEYDHVRQGKLLTG